MPLSPDVDALPFLVRHGGWFWVVFLVALALVNLAIAALARHVRELVRVRDELRRIRWSLQASLTEGYGSILGRWAADAVIVAGERVALADGWRIVVGSHLADGAEVMVRGDLVRAPVREAGYRDSARGWRVRNAEVHATRPRVRARSRTWPRRIAGCVGALAISLLTLRLAAGVMNKRLAEPAPNAAGGRPLVLPQLDTVAIAASLPGSRANALARLERQLEGHPFHDEASVRRRLGLALVMHGPCSRMWILHAMPEAQLAWATRCLQARTAFQLQMSLGRFDDAWRNRPPDHDAPEQLGMLAIVTGHWADAATYADERAAFLERQAAARPDARRFRCLGHWFRSLGGQPEAAAQLRQLAAAVCAPIVAQTLPVAERVAYLQRALAALEPDDSRGHAHVRAALWLEGVDDERLDDHEITVALARGDLVTRAWLLPFGVDAWRGAARNEVRALGGIVLREVHRGDFAAAHRTLDEAARLARDKATRDTVHAWSEYLAVREGVRTLPARADVDTYMDVLKLRRGEAPRHGLAGYPESCEDLLAAAVTAAQRGDGRPLATAMQSCRVYSTFATTVFLGILPLVEHGRTELATALRWWDEDAGFFASAEPFHTLARAAARRDIARFVGDPESAARWAETARRFLRPLEDRTKAFALLLWQD